MKVVALWMLGVLVFGSAPALADDEFINYILGETQITVWVYDNGPGLTYFAPHDDENTSVAVAMEAVAQHGGRVVQLAHKNTRNTSFVYNGVTYTFDPNRIFSDQGIVATLRAQGKTYSPEAHNMVRAFAGDILRILLSGARPLVAVHNNTNGSYSIYSYAAGGNLAGEAEAIHVSKAWDEDDFFFVTTRQYFDFLQGYDLNVVLQSRGATDDGSLSVYSAKHGIPYINVEAQAGHTAAQAHMLAVLNGS